MALTPQVIQASSAADLVNLVNTYLATLANPKIISWSIGVADLPTRIGTEFRFLIETDTGGAALVTPFLLDIVSASGSPALQTALATYLSTYAAQFVSGPKLLWAPNDENVSASLISAAYLRNTTAGASANYLIQA
jgi:hypothetical protein